MESGFEDTLETRARTSDVKDPASGSSRTLQGDFLWALGGNLVYAVAQWAILVVLAKLGDAEMVGQFALATAITMPVLLVTNLYLRAQLATDMRRTYPFADYWGLRLLTTLLGAAVILLIAGFGTFSTVTMWVIVLVGLGKLWDALADICLGLFQQRLRMPLLAITVGVNGIVSLAAVLAAMWLTHNILWAAFGSMLGSAVALVGVALPGVIRTLAPVSAKGYETLGVLRPHFDPATLRRLAWRAAPLGFASLRSILSLNIPRYFIAYYQGEQALGIFAALTSLVLAGLIATTALSTSMTARLAGYFAAKDAGAFRRLMVRLVQIGIVQLIAGVVIAEFAGAVLLNLVFGAEYAIHNYILVLLAFMGGMYALIGFFETGLTALGSFTVQVRIQAVSLVLIVVLCLWLVPAYGSLGAAVGMCAGALLATLAYAGALYRSFRKSFGNLPVSPVS